MKRPVILAACLALFLWTGPLPAVEELMTKLAFDNWLRNATGPLETNIARLSSSYTEMAQTAERLKKQLITEILVTIGQNTAIIDGKQVPLDTAPVIQTGRTFVPVRFVGEAFGAQFSWDAKTKKVTFILDDTKAELYIGKKTAKINGRSVTLAAAPFLTDGRTMVPLRFLSEAMGAQLSWDENTQTVTINR